MRGTAQVVPPETGIGVANAPPTPPIRLCPMARKMLAGVSNPPASRHDYIGCGLSDG